MKKLYAAVLPDGSFDFNTIEHSATKVKITESDYKYGKTRVKPVLMQRFKEDLPKYNNDYELWQQHQIAWIWSNPDGSYWWDTLSLDKETTRKWSSKPETMIGLGFKVIPVQFFLKHTAHLIAA